MELTFSQIQGITCGAVSVTQETDGIHFYRFDEAQYAVYEAKNLLLYNKALASAGVKLSFETDSRTMSMEFLMEKTCTRTYFSVDVYVDGKLAGVVNNYGDRVLPQDYSVMDFPLGAFSGSFCLGEGKKTVVIHLPWNIKTVLQKMTLEDGATIQPVKPGKKLLAYGDSITQGFDALMPSHRYIARLAEALGAEEFNKAIGAECFCPDVLGAAAPFCPDVIVVAYGTNDWSKTSPEVFAKNSAAFFKLLTEKYPAVPIYAVTPIWRSNINTVKSQFSAFEDIERGIRAAVADIPQAKVITGIDLVPGDLSCFGDFGLHPNDLGFSNYFKNLWGKMQ